MHAQALPENICNRFDELIFEITFVIENGDHNKDLGNLNTCV